MLLDSCGSVEEKNMIFFQVKGGTRGFTKVIENGSKFVGFLSGRGVQEHCVIYKLVVRGRRLKPM